MHLGVSVCFVVLHNKIKFANKCRHCAILLRMFTFE